MAIIAWLVSLVVLSVVIGEVCFRRAKKGAQKVVLDARENVDASIGQLNIERPQDDFVSSQLLAVRGSWRLSQNAVLAQDSFVRMRSEEYGKQL